MNQIDVTVEIATENGRLYPQYDSESDILEIGSKYKQEWALGIDVNGNIIFDLNKDGLICNIDLLIPRKFWVEMANLEWPLKTEVMDIVISRRSIDYKSFDIPIKVFSNREIIKILLSEKRVTSSVSLSSDCVIQLSGWSLGAIFVRL